MDRAGFASEVVVPRAQKLLRESFNARMVGFMLSRAWVYVVFFSTALLPNARTQGTLDLLNDLSRGALIATLLIGSLALEPAVGRLACARWRHAPAVVAIVGTLLVPLSGTSDAFGQAVLLAASVLTGVGSGLFMLLWGSVYGKLSGPLVAAEASLAYALSALVMPACFAFPFWFQAVVVVALMLGSSALLGRELDRPDGEAPATNHPSSQPDLLQPIETRHLLAKIAASSVAFSFVLNVLRFLYERQDLGALDLSPLFVLTVPAIAAGGIVLAVLLCSKRLDLAFSYRPVLWLLALGCFLLPLFDRGSALPYLFARTGYVCFTILAWVMMADLAYRSSTSTFKIFGVGQASCSIGLALGALSGRALEAAGFSPAENSLALSGVLVFALIVTYTLILTERGVSRMIAKPSEKPDPLREADAERAKAHDRCEALAARHGLGERATEVLALYSRGRSRSRIEQELYISKGTVNFHLRNIYQTLGIHSRQELLDLLDDDTLDEDPYE